MSSTTGSDATVEVAREDSIPALEELYRDLHPRVLAYLRARAPREADDLSSEVWLDVTRGLTRFSGDEDGFQAWVFTIARRRLIDARRRAQRRPTTPLAELEGVAAAHDTESIVVNAISVADARQLIETLPKAQADVVRLRMVDGLTIDETAAALGKQPGTVRVLQHRGFRRLARMVAFALVFALLSGLAAAGALPAPLQRVADRIFSSVGAAVPEAGANGADTAEGGRTQWARTGNPGDLEEADTLGMSSAPVARAVSMPVAATEARAPGSSVEPSRSADGAPPASRVSTPGQAAPPAEVITPPRAVVTPPGHGGSPPGFDGDLPPGHGGTPPGLDGGLPPGQGGTPPGLDGGLPPGQGGTPPGLDGDLPPGHGGTPPGLDGGLPPGQAKKIPA